MCIIRFERVFSALGTVAVLAVALVACTAFAKGPVNADGAGVAIHGYDPVAYFTDEKAIAGNASHRHRWQDVTWRFASAEHRDVFAKNPAAYAPQYGGYCAYAVSKGQTADIDPKAWKVVDGKLYLNYSPAVQKKWEAERAQAIADADAKWPQIRAGLKK